MRRAAMLVAAAILAALLFHPLAGAKPYADDFAFLAMTHQLEEPWRLLVQDAFGLFFFRPVVAFSWWVSVAAFGDAWPLHYLANVLLHLGCAAMLYAFVRSLSVSAPVAAAAALAFAAHPTAYSAAAWLSDRFDLFATLFGFASLVAMQRFLAGGGARWAAASCLAAFASMLSKETGFIYPAVAWGLLVWAGTEARLPSQRSRGRAAVGLGVTVLAVLALRKLVLRPSADALFFESGVVTTVLQGVEKWARFLPDFVVAQAGNPVAVFTWLAVLVLFGASALAAAGRGVYDRALGRAVAVGVVLMLLSALVQSPVIRASRVLPYHFAGLPAGAAMFDWLVSHRYYYVSLAGFFVLLAALGEGAWRVLARRGHLVAIAASLLVLAGATALVASSRSVGRDWARFTREQDAGLVRAAAEALAPRDWPAGCKVYLLGTHERSNTFLYGSDVIVKHTLPRGHSLAGCLVQTEVTPWFQVADNRKVRDVSPLEVIRSQGKPYEPLQVGNMSVYYLRIPDSDAVRQDPLATFLAYDGKRFTDVTAEVRSGARPVKFFDNRPPG